MEYPDGTVGTVWSPVLHSLTPDAEERAARRFARRLFDAGEHQAHSAPPEQPT